MRQSIELASLFLFAVIVVGSPDLRHDTIYRAASPQVLRKWFAPGATPREKAVAP